MAAMESKPPTRRLAVPLPSPLPHFNLADAMVAVVATNANAASAAAPRFSAFQQSEKAS